MTTLLSIVQRTYSIGAVAVVGLALSSDHARAAVVVNPSFETLESIDSGASVGFGDWVGDASTILGPELGITPHDGTRMLKFGATNGTAPSLSSSDVFQLIDVSSYSAAILAGGMMANASAFFNRVAGDAQTDTRFFISLTAFSGGAGGYPSGQLATQFTEIFSDADTLSWEEAMVSLLLPTNTSYLSISVSASENIFNDNTSPEFEGHYADSLSLSIVPEPSRALMAGFALICTLFRRSRFSQL